MDVQIQFPIESIHKHMCFSGLCLGVVFVAAAAAAVVAVVVVVVVILRGV